MKESEEKVRVIFVLYNERDMSLLPGENEKRKFVASAKQLVGVLEKRVWLGR